MLIAVIIIHNPSYSYRNKVCLLLLRGGCRRSNLYFGDWCYRAVASHARDLVPRNDRAYPCGYNSSAYHRGDSV